MKELTYMKLLIRLAAQECWPASFNAAFIIYQYLIEKARSAHGKRIFQEMKNEIWKTWRETERGFEFEISVPGINKD